MKNLINDIVKYHFSNREYLFAEALIKEDRAFAEALAFELEMQLMFNDRHETEHSLLNQMEEGVDYVEH